MTHVFYLFGVLFIIYSMIIMASYKEYTNFLNKLKQKQDKQDKPDTTAALTGCFIALVSVGFLFWSVLGLLTFQWPVFVLLIVFSFIPTKHYVIRLFKSLVILAILVFIVLNAYHFNIDVLSFIK